MRGAEFASDNTAGICPEALASLLTANTDYVASYGADAWTAKVCQQFRELFETDCEVFFVFNGTAANSLALASLCQSYNSVICHELAHVETDECGGPEFFSNGAKLLLVPGKDAKVTPEAVRSIVTRRNDIHYPKAKVLTITQSTEMGTVYSQAEIAALCDTSKSLGLRIYLDGARFANAFASSGLTSPAAMTWKLGIDAMCFGGTKLGLPVGEAVIFFNKHLAEDFDFRCKQSGQLASKMRFLSAPWHGILQQQNWLKLAQHANQMAQHLSHALVQRQGVELLAETQANAVFVTFPLEVVQHLDKLGWKYYKFIGAGGARFVCSWATQMHDINALLNDIDAGLSK